MKKILLILVAVIGFGISANAQDFCDEAGNRIEFYPEEDFDGKKSFFNGGNVQVAVEGNMLIGEYKIQESNSSSRSYLVIEFYDKGKSKPAFYGKYYRGTTSREGAVLKKAYIEILGVKLETCKRK
ncbi:MAG: hypothetical protein LBK47_08210 [Prevotellaceae bacterium]|jgi:hypothetical protein|nr:hypothetical protein [Prevotellaceae bacterium]